MSQTNTTTTSDATAYDGFRNRETKVVARTLTRDRYFVEKACDLLWEEQGGISAEPRNYLVRILQEWRRRDATRGASDVVAALAEDALYAVDMEQVADAIMAEGRALKAKYSKAHPEG